MTPLAIRTAILADNTLRGLIESGADNAVAAALTATAPKVPSGVLFTEKGVYAELGPSVAETILQKFATYADAADTYSAIVKRVLSWMKPDQEGIDFQLASTLQLIDALTVGGLLTAEENAALKTLSLKPDVITADDVSKAVAQWRPNGTVGPIPS